MLLAPIAALNPTVVVKSGYGARAPLPLAALARYDTVWLAGADTDACVLATALGMFDGGGRVVVREDLCWSSGGVALHRAGLAVLRRQLGATRVYKPPTAGGNTPGVG
jgi:nicotinamidase-related amidase